MMPEWLERFDSLWFFDNNKLSERKLTVPLIPIIVGQFFEVLTANIMNAEYSSRPDGWDVYPDVIKYDPKNGDELYEVKAGMDKVHIHSDQLKGYENIISNEFPFHNPKVMYALYFHNVKNLHRKCKTVNQLVSELTKSINYSVILTYNQIKLITAFLPIHNWGEMKSFVIRKNIINDIRDYAAADIKMDILDYKIKPFKQYRILTDK